MGVLGFTPFLQKTCPEVIKHLPNRLRSLTGKTIVIDGTLVTQRFHFAQAPHPYRHVLGWYRLIRELNDASVSAICVFDGKERSSAKWPEIERRKEIRRLAAARGSLENDRLKRLHMLSDVLYKIRNLDIVARGRAAELLRQLHSDHDIPLSVVPKPPSAFLRNGHRPEPTSDITSDDELEASLSSPLYLSCAEPDLMYGCPSSNELSSVDVLTVCDSSVAEDSAFVDVAALAQSLEDDSALAQSLEDNLSLSSHQELIEDPEVICPIDVLPYPVDLLTQEAELGVQEISLPDADSANRTSYDSNTVSQERQALSSTFASLYFDFRQSISKFAMLAARESSALSSFVSTQPSDLDTQAEIVMTKAQYQLTLDERNLWEQLVSLPSIITDSSEDEFSSAVETTLADLTQTSNVMFESYQRRTNPPTTQTYEDSKSMIQAMGVPCIDSVGPFEAEALASSIVLSGLADYVASEDTDVLVYDAPLIRNLTNRQSPLTVVSGVDIRMVLELDRASFIDFALLLGTDFSQRIRNIGPARALKFIKAHGSIERVIELETKYAPQIPHNIYLAQVEVARMVYQTLPPVPEKSRLQQGDVDETMVVKLLEQFKLDTLMRSDWDYSAALEGNYFQDDPCAS